MSVGLPFDVLHIVIEMLATDNPPAFATMRSVSQTCRYLLPVCRKHIFSAIWLKTRIDGADVPNHARAKHEATLHIGATNLAKLIASSPDIAGYVRELIFYPDPSNSGDETLLPLLQKFDRLRKLRFGKSAWLYPHWEDLLDDTLQLAMRNLIHQQRHTLTHLNFTEFLNIPSSIIYPLTCLHSFHLIDSIIYTDVVADPPVPLQLTSLIFTAGEGIEQRIFAGVRTCTGIPFFDLSQLRKFIATICSTETVDEGVTIGRLLRGMRRLKKLVIYVQGYGDDIPPNFPDIFNSIHPEASVNLETLRFQLWYSSNPANNSQLPGAILQKTRAFPCLKDLRMNLCIVLPIDPAPVIEDLMALDTLLCSEKFSTLESVSLSPFISSMNDAYHDVPEWLNIPVLMPRSSSNPALKFDCTPQRPRLV